MAKNNCPAEDSAPPQASAGQLTPRFLPLSLSGRLLQVTVAISPSAAKGASKGAGFLRASDRKAPQTNAGFRKVGERGASATKQEASLALCVSVGWEGVLFCRESSLLVTFVNAAFVGGPSGLRKPENSEAPFRNFLSARGYGWLR